MCTMVIGLEFCLNFAGGQAGRLTRTHIHTHGRRVGEGALLSSASLFQNGLGTFVSDPNAIFVAVSLWVGEGAGQWQWKRRRRRRRRWG